VSSHFAHESEAARPNEQGADEKVVRVLVADDSDTSRAVTVYALTTMGLDVDAVANGEEAVLACATRRYDLVLMDYHMPKLDGCEATRRIRASEPAGVRTTILALTASGAEDDLERCRQVGMDGCLFKLMAPQELRDALRSWLTPPSPLGRDDERIERLTQMTPMTANSATDTRQAGDTHAAADTTVATDTPGAPGASDAAASAPSELEPARTAGRGGVDASSIDWSVIDALRAFSTEDDLLHEILASFHTNVNDSLPELERAARAGEAETTRFIAHRLRGTCGNVGAVRMQFLYARIEELGRAGVTAGASELISDLWSEYARVRAAFGEGGAPR
jgi:CheY-like chemotaxis protein/HPt (histidine-containing phosphotransfer) domain-containing protein